MHLQLISLCISVCYIQLQYSTMQNNFFGLIGTQQKTPDVYTSTSTTRSSLDLANSNTRPLLTSSPHTYYDVPDDIRSSFVRNPQPSSSNHSTNKSANLYVCITCLVFYIIMAVILFIATLVGIVGSTYEGPTSNIMLGPSDVMLISTFDRSEVRGVSFNSEYKDVNFVATFYDGRQILGY